jgi:lipoprotein NlpI
MRSGKARSRRAVFAATAAVLCSTAAWAQSANELNSLGVSRYEESDWRTALDHFGAALRLDPENSTIRRNYTNACQALASEHAQAGNYESAIRQIETAVQTDPANPMPLMQLGAYYLHEGRVREAIFRLEEAIELAPGDTDAHYLLGEAYYRDNDAVSALDQWVWVQNVDPDRSGLAERIETARREREVEAEYKGRSSRHFNVTFDREAEGRLVRDVVAILEQAYRDVGRALGQTYPPVPVQVSLYTAEDFQHTTMMGGHVGAVYDGNKIRCPAIGPDGQPLPLAELRRRLYHEYVHVVVRHIARDGVPWWLNEGLAEALTTDLTGREIAFLREARDRQAWYDLKDLSEGQLDKLDAAGLYLAYKQSQATVAYLSQRYGTRRLTHVLMAVAGGEDTETALRRMFRHSYATLQLAVADYVQNG